MSHESEELHLSGILESGDQTRIWGELEKQRERLRRLVDLRLDDRLQARLDASDVVQDALAEAYQRLPEYLARRDMPFIVWIRFLTVQKVRQLHRFHLGTERRDPHREAASLVQPAPEASSAMLADCLAASGLSASEQFSAQERTDRLREAVIELSANDREILALRHSEQLTNQEAALVLGLEPATASQRYLRAVARLGKLLDASE